MTRDLPEIPLFPLNVVLYPGGRLALRIFEQRYMDMAKVCIKDGSGFGVCLIQHGREVGAPATPQQVGTLARIIDWDMPQLGVLKVMAEGGQRFRIIDHHAERSGLLRATIEMIAPEPAQAIPPVYEVVAGVLRTIFSELGKQAPPPPHNFNDAAWVGYRFCELLPFALEEKQFLLEEDDSMVRLDKVLEYLKRRDLLRG